jgi:hypothetical protein
MHGLRYCGFLETRNQRNSRPTHLLPLAYPQYSNYRQSCLCREWIVDNEIPQPKRVPPDATPMQLVFLRGDDPSASVDVELQNSLNHLAKGYRWVAINGPYACDTEQDLRRITSDHTDLRELYMVENLQAYYLIPGTLARVIRDDHAEGMSEILLAGILTPLWTYTKFLSARPIQGHLRSYGNTGQCRTG